MLTTGLSSCRGSGRTEKDVQLHPGVDGEDQDLAALPDEIDDVAEERRVHRRLAQVEIEESEGVPRDGDAPVPRAGRQRVLERLA